MKDIRGKKWRKFLSMKGHTLDWKVPVKQTGKERSSLGHIIWSKLQWQKKPFLYRDSESLLDSLTATALGIRKQCNHASKYECEMIFHHGILDTAKILKV